MDEIEKLLDNEDYEKDLGGKRYCTQCGQDTTHVPLHSCDNEDIEF